MNNVPRLKLSAVGKSTFQTPNIPGMRYNGYVKSPRGAGRISVFDTKHGFYTEGSAQTARTARSNAVSASPSWCLQSSNPMHTTFFLTLCSLLLCSVAFPSAPYTSTASLLWCNQSTKGICNEEFGHPRQRRGF